MSGGVALAAVEFGSRSRSPGGGTLINLVAATTNALNGALLALRPDHYKNFSVVGIVLMAVLGGFATRLTALYRGWEEPLAPEPSGAYQHDEGRPSSAANSPASPTANCANSASWSTPKILPRKAVPPESSAPGKPADGPKP